MGFGPAPADSPSMMDHRSHSNAMDRASLRTTSLNDRLLTAIRDFDRYMKNGGVERVSLEEAAYILDQIERFNFETEHYRASEKPRPETERLIAAGCRLATDLSAKVMGRMMDMLEESDQSLNALNRQLRDAMRQRCLSTTILQKAQQARHGTSRAAESAGLGVIL